MATLDQITDGYVSAEDEDFVPDAGVMAEAAAASARLAKASKKQSTLQLVKKRKAKASAAAAWASMRGDADTDTTTDEVGAGGGTTAAVAGSDASAAVPGGSATDTKKAKGEKPKAKTKKKRKAADLLASLNRSSKKRGADARKVLSNILGGKVVRRAKKKARVSRVSMPVGGSVAGKVVVSDIVKFAGKAIRVTKAMDAAEAQKKGLTAVGGGGGGSGASAATSAAHAGASHIDDVVEAMQDVHKVNTVEKSSMDWDTYKVETGLGDEVEAAAKNGYVGRQEFLERVDHRQYGLEVEERRQQRAAAAAAVAATAKP